LEHLECVVELKIKDPSALPEPGGVEGLQSRKKAKERLRHKRDVILGGIKQPGFEV
jgi:hypothetical protein